MVIVNMKSVVELGLPLNSKDMIEKKDQEYKEAKRKVKFFQKKYGYSSNRVIAAVPYCQEFDRIIFRDIPSRDRKEWQRCFRKVVVASRKYKFLIAFFNLMMLDLDNEIEIIDEDTFR